MGEVSGAPIPPVEVVEPIAPEGCECGGPENCGPESPVIQVFLQTNTLSARLAGPDGSSRYVRRATKLGLESIFKFSQSEIGLPVGRLTIAVLDEEGRRSAAVRLSR